MFIIVDNISFLVYDNKHSYLCKISKNKIFCGKIKETNYKCRIINI